jgi:oxygen-independent coproporphyrinogen-3 oxidase
MDQHFSISPPLSLYIHLPWCVRKCPYCDFNSYSASGAIPESEYVEALLRDLDNDSAQLGKRRIETVFMGGGTPSLFSPEALNRVLTKVRTDLKLSSGVEITLEANPGAIDQGKFKEFHAIGINRLSIGVQSFNNESLRELGRIHDGTDGLRAVELARKAGFDNLNIDLMYGLPGQTKEMCVADLSTAVRLAPSHISYYQLTLEPRTLFYSRPPALPHERVLCDMEDVGRQIFLNHGYTQYEVSAYAQAGMRSRHNLNYWEFGDYLGIGAGAHGKLTQIATHLIHRSSKSRQPKQYMASASHEAQQSRVLTPEDAVFEFMLNAFRLQEGFCLSLFRERTGMSVDAISSRLESAVEQGLLSIDGSHLSATVLGRRFLNDLIMLFMPDPMHPVRG